MKKNRVLRKCKQCRKKIEVRLSSVKKGFGLFCDEKCYGKWIRVSKIRSGSNNYAWKGEKAGYGPKHAWLTKNFGKANKCENREKQVLKFPCKNISTDYEWSNISGKHLRTKTDYRMLCVSCHRKLDFTEEMKINLRNKLKGRPTWNKGKKTGPFKLERKLKIATKLREFHAKRKEKDNISTNI